jgi:hypothetical protein
MDRVLGGVESKTSDPRASRHESSNQRTATNRLLDKLLQKRTPRLKEPCSFSGIYCRKGTCRKRRGNSPWGLRQKSTSPDQVVWLLRPAGRHANSALGRWIGWTPCESGAFLYYSTSPCCWPGRADSNDMYRARPSSSWPISGGMVCPTKC